jgi:hypothetical protein
MINTGIVCQDKGDPMKAIEYFGQALKIKEEPGDRFANPQGCLHFALYTLQFALCTNFTA